MMAPGPQTNSVSQCSNSVLFPGALSFLEYPRRLGWGLGARLWALVSPLPTGRCWSPSSGTPTLSELERPPPYTIRLILGKARETLARFSLGKPRSCSWLCTPGSPSGDSGKQSMGPRHLKFCRHPVQRGG